MKEHIIDLCNRELAKRRRLSPVGGDKQGGGAEQEQEKTDDLEQTKDAPLVRGYDFLREFPVRIFPTFAAANGVELTRIPLSLPTQNDSL
jgi:hypothetical protein